MVGTKQCWAIFLMTANILILFSGISFCIISYIRFQTENSNERIFDLLTHVFTAIASFVGLSAMIAKNRTALVSYGSSIILDVVSSLARIVVLLASSEESGMAYFPILISYRCVTLVLDAAILYSVYLLVFSESTPLNEPLDY
ncbi:hypothetical protein BOX15_Mlig022368g3 [Macrostomum lignano]|uniref:Uncharacterized protein n=2 Tax=Macrostomum lignano TaxID=282301 RepID=A0A267DYR3_9PLAT|nr:hypothetical protein BOX15_Mlig022368g2 [Macrostomum lignano]PAA86132.1 hypothetical protein BOX15_Mlig022368g3 [Macrostomum lignano]